MSRRSDGSGALVVRIKASLRGIAPVVWRRVELPASATLAQLHQVFQIAFGWGDHHLHEFRFGEALYGTPDSEAPADQRDDRNVRVGQLLAAGMAGVYCYDFGDGWQHDLLVEQIAPADPAVTYPICTGGARACPPEGCGGPGGYAELLARLASPKHERHLETRTWLGGYFDPEAFDPNRTNRLLWRERGLRFRR